MRRPLSVTAIGWFLIAWNTFAMISSLPQDLYYHKMPFTVALIVRIISLWSVFITIGVAMLCGKNWARIGYLFFAPIHVITNLILGTIRLGMVNIVDRIPSLVLTVLFMVILLRPTAKAWFLGVPVPPTAFPPKKEKPAMIKLVNIVGLSIVAMIALLWLTNHFLRISSLGDEQNQGVIEYYLSN